MGVVLGVVRYRLHVGGYAFNMSRVLNCLKEPTRATSWIQYSLRSLSDSPKDGVKKITQKTLSELPGIALPFRDGMMLVIHLVET